MKKILVLLFAFIANLNSYAENWKECSCSTYPTMTYYYVNEGQGCCPGAVQHAISFVYEQNSENAWVLIDTILDVDKRQAQLDCCPIG